MKKILLIAAFFISTGVMSSCTKDNVSPKVSKTIADEDLEDNQLGIGAGGVDRPPVRKP